ncbi:hypothetical protein CsSME_00040999 [Camellia sinensis var. sinensis]
MLLALMFENTGKDHMQWYLLSCRRNLRVMRVVYYHAQILQDNTSWCLSKFSGTSLSGRGFQETSSSMV